MQELDMLTGTVEQIVYFNEYTNYTVFDLDTDGLMEVVTGIFPQLTEGENITVYGVITEHKIYGRQFNASGYKINVPATNEALKKYLSSGLFKGIGPSNAEKLVDHFGEDVLHIIKNEPHRLTEVSKIGEKTAKKIAEAFFDQEQMREVIMFMQNYDISTSYALKIYKKYQAASIELVSQNPYRLIEDIPGIGFKMADKIALALGIEENSSFRVRAGIGYVLSTLCQRGNMFSSEDDLLSHASFILHVDGDIIQDGIDFLCKVGKIVLDIVNEENVYYPYDLYTAEKDCAKILSGISHNSFDFHEGILNNFIKEYESLYDITFHESQRKAVLFSITHGLSVITGGPGTGKTTIIKCVLYILEKLNKNVLLCAPTGRAAKRLSSASGKEAKTLHRLLEYTFSSEERMVFLRNEDNLLEGDCIIVDEASMIDIKLLYYLLKAMNKTMQLILVGDVDQLPSVAPGNILKDIIGSGAANTSKLEMIFRQSQRSMIVVNAHNINMGKMPVIDNKSDDFFFLDAPTPSRALQKVLELCASRLATYKNYDPIYDIQVISHVKRGITGVENLNKQLQQVLNPPSKDKAQKNVLGYILRQGDKVMQVKNNYNALWTNIQTAQTGMGIFNGDIGVLEKINTEDKILTVLFEQERLVNYSFEDADQLMLSYAITTHKSQGSEFKAVIILMCEGYGQFLSRNLLYTALTRAKQTAILVGSRRIVEMMVANNTSIDRKTALCERIQNETLHF
jgi:exodeoxyribonuclease V alpha subunit